jgi:hypothetical protein
VEGLLAVSATAFTAVFVLLALLAVVMHVITLVFPERPSRIDPVLVAAITSTVSTLYPNARVTKIEEES